MPIPTESVGSLPRPRKLQEAYAAYDAGKVSTCMLAITNQSLIPRQITYDQLALLQDEVCKDSIERMEETGQWCVTDGESRESSFATYPLTDTLSGTGLAEMLAPDGQYFAIFDDG